MEKRVRDCVKAHIRDCPESIMPLESERLQHNKFYRNEHNCFVNCVVFSREIL